MPPTSATVVVAKTPADAFAPVTDPLPTSSIIDWHTIVGERQHVELSLHLPVPDAQLRVGARYYGGMLTRDVDVHSFAPPHTTVNELNRADPGTFGTFDFTGTLEWSWASLASIRLYSDSIRNAVQAAEARVTVGLIRRGEAHKALRQWMGALENLHYYAVVGAAVERSGLGLLDQVFQIGKAFQASIQLDTAFPYGEEPTPIVTIGNPYLPAFVSDWASEAGV